MTATAHPITELDLASATGVWAISSESATTYYVDTDRGLLCRVPGDGSSTGPFDGVWVKLIDMTHNGEQPDGSAAGCSVVTGPSSRSPWIGGAGELSLAL